MAEGGEVAGRREVLLKCSPCVEDGNNITASKFCKQCQTAFCEQCLKNHNKLFRKHYVKCLQYDVLSGDNQTTMSSPIDICVEHAKVIDLYCQDHDKVGCSTCMALEHRRCERVLYIPNSTHELLQQDDVKMLNSQMTETIKNLESIKMEQETTQTGLDERRSCRIEEIDAKQVKIQDILVKMAKASKDEVEQTYKVMSTDLQRCREDVESCLRDLKSSLDRLNTCNDNKTQQFIALKKCQEEIKTKKQLTTNTHGNVRLEALGSSLANEMANFLSKLMTLVPFSRPLSVKKRYEIYVSGEHGSRIALLNDGSLLISDDTILKRIDGKSLFVTDQLSIQNRFDGICCIDDNEAIVTQGRQLLVVSLKPRLTKSRILPMNHHCASVASYNNELFVTDERETLYVYNMRGSLLRKINFNAFGHKLFSRPGNVAVSDDGTKVYVKDGNRTLITLDRHGSVLSKHFYEEFRSFCPDGCGGLLICKLGSTNVVHIDRLGRVLGDVVYVEAGSISVCFDSNIKRLYVTQGCHTELLAFDLE